MRVLIPEVFNNTSYLGIFEIAEAEVVIICRRTSEETALYAGLIVKFKRKEEVKLYESKPVYATAMDASEAMLHVRREAQNFVEHERKK